MKLDTFDRRILNLVQEDASLTGEKLSESVALSVSAIQRRIRRLHEAGVIQRNVSIVDPQHAGRPTFFVVALQIERERPELLAQLRRWLANEPQVQQAFYVTGEADFVLIVTAPDTASYDELMSRMVRDNANIRHFTTNVALGVIKRGLAIPIAIDGID
ncbi:MAG: Lrp/AsnC family transcriptional regulator [Sphingomonas sp.]|uniref:Lrp/AsnC family transcriptional regulator n=1 Tax=Sphingomonas sp. TaxID=28214 RepID=UPI001B18D8B3|nr:Lrp/AsnC family transcriptional regulator [Sphingomonas sp.]MBO9621571.1 Lrp/AsnC family transcriptional regulator [Sphingomonas sp.]